MRNNLSHLVLIALLTAACGKQEENSASNPGVTIHKQEQRPEGIYRVVLNSTDPSSQNATGAGTIRISDQKIAINLKMINLPKQSKLYQFVNTAGICPKMEHDQNKDGVLDFQEVKKVAGEILIPLNNDLAAEALGTEGMPVSNSQGFYAYEEEASWEDFMGILRSPAPNDNLVKKLSATENLNLSGKSLLIMNISSRSGDAWPEKAIPLACGKIVKVQEED